MILSSISLHAQNAPADYFVGKWTVSVEDTPMGDMTMNIAIERVDGTLTGTLGGGEMEAIKFSKIEEVKDKSVTLYFSTPDGYDVYIYLEKKDDNAVKASIMDMFDANGIRVIEDK